MWAGKTELIQKWKGFSPLHALILLNNSPCVPPCHKICSFSLQLTQLFKCLTRSSNQAHDTQVLLWGAPHGHLQKQKHQRTSSCRGAFGDSRHSTCSSYKLEDFKESHIFQVSKIGLWALLISSASLAWLKYLSHLWDFGIVKSNNHYILALNGTFP